LFRLPGLTHRAQTETPMDRTGAPHGYAIRGGREGKERLDLLARVMLPTMQLLDRVGLMRGQNRFSCSATIDLINRIRYVEVSQHVCA
jgi:hypothetical protein